MKIFTTCNNSFKMALPESIFRLTVMIFKILKGGKQSTSSAASRD